MLCDACHKNEATIHIQEITGNQKKTIHLCSDCAAKKPQFGKLDLGLNDLAGLFYELTGKGAPPDAAAQEPPKESAETALRCPRCGWNGAKLRRTGRLGCAECYRVFAPLLADALKNMHRGTLHTGKRPGDAPEARERGRQLAELQHLQDELQQAIAEEAYENAAGLRDRINALKTRLNGGKNANGGEAAHA